MYEKIKVLTNEEYEKNKHSDRFIHSVAFAHGVMGWEEHNIALCKYITGTDYKVSKELQEEAEKEYKKRKQEIIKNKGNKLVFVGMGMDFEPSTINHIGNHRIRTYFKNSKGILCFVEFGTGRDKDFMRCDFALFNTKKDSSEWNSLSEREKTEKRILELENLRGNYTPYTKDKILELVNKHFDCNFKEVEVYNYFISTEDYISISE